MITAEQNRRLTSPDDQISDADLARTVEHLEMTGADLPAIAANLGYPPSPDGREPARHRALNRRSVLSLAAH